MKKNVPDQNSFWPEKGYHYPAEEWAYNNFSEFRKVWSIHNKMCIKNEQRYSFWKDRWKEDVSILLGEVLSGN